MLRFEIRQVLRGKKAGQYRWRLVAANGEVIATSGSETYHNKRDCLHAVGLVQASAEADIFDLTSSSE